MKSDPYEMIEFRELEWWRAVKIRHHFRKYSDLKIDAVKNVNNKKCAPNFFPFKKKEKDLDDF